jgi:ElaB/YqjD/DUF883 family membrane-anchored ribosome-binding protein
MARDLKTEAEQTIEDLSSQMAELKAQLAEMTTVAKRRGGAMAAKLRDRGETAVEDAKARAEGYFAEADAAVRQNPATAMGLALGVGFLLGVAISRR